MADEPQTNWYPTPDHPRQDTDRIIFDNLYRLRDQYKQEGKGPKPQTQQGMSATVFFPGGFMVGNKTFYSMTFGEGGVLKGVS